MTMGKELGAIKMACHLADVITGHQTGDLSLRELAKKQTYFKDCKDILHYL